MGKSQIALEFCYRNQENYRYIFWIEADKETTLQKSFEKLARPLNIAKSYSDPEDVRSSVIHWLQTSKG
jgi:hypothetical protein